MSTLKPVQQIGLTVEGALAVLWLSHYGLNLYNLVLILKSRPDKVIKFGFLTFSSN